MTYFPARQAMGASITSFGGRAAPSAAQRQAAERSALARGVGPCCWNCSCDSNVCCDGQTGQLITGLVVTPPPAGIVRATATGARAGVGACCSDCAKPKATGNYLSAMGAVDPTMFLLGPDGKPIIKPKVTLAPPDNAPQRLLTAIKVALRPPVPTPGVTPPPPSSKLPLLLGLAAVGVGGFFVVKRLRKGRRR